MVTIRRQERWSQLRHPRRSTPPLRTCCHARGTHIAFMQLVALHIFAHGRSHSQRFCRSLRMVITVARGSAHLRTWLFLQPEVLHIFENCYSHSQRSCTSSHMVIPLARSSAHLCKWLFLDASQLDQHNQNCGPNIRYLYNHPHSPLPFFSKNQEKM